MTAGPAGPSADELAHELLVVGVARNCGHTLPAAVAHIQAALPGFARVHWRVVESDSDDDTVDVLRRLAAEVPHFSFQTFGALQSALPLRTQRIAHCRNACLDHLRDHPSCARVRYVIVADLDGINTRLTAAGVASCWQRSDWAACAANPAGPYYDIWALRHPLWSAGDCWAQWRFLCAHGQDEQRAKMATVYSRMIVLAPDAAWLEVESAFGGFAVYRAEALRTARYEGVSASGEEVCEHVVLHAALRAAGGRIFINPALINADASASDAYWPERAQTEAVGRSALFRGLLRLFYGKQASRQLRTLLRSLH